eukprot:g18480.t1
MLLGCGPCPRTEGRAPGLRAVPLTDNTGTPLTVSFLDILQGEQTGARSIPRGWWLLDGNRTDAHGLCPRCCLMLIDMDTPHSQ